MDSTVVGNSPKSYIAAEQTHIKNSPPSSPPFRLDNVDKNKKLTSRAKYVLEDNWNEVMSKCTSNPLYTYYCVLYKMQKKYLLFYAGDCHSSL